MKIYFKEINKFFNLTLYTNYSRADIRKITLHQKEISALQN